MSELGKIHATINAKFTSEFKLSHGGGISLASARDEKSANRYWSPVKDA